MAWVKLRNDKFANMSCLKWSKMNKRLQIIVRTTKNMLGIPTWDRRNGPKLMCVYHEWALISIRTQMMTFYYAFWVSLCVCKLLIPKRRQSMKTSKNIKTFENFQDYPNFVYWVCTLQLLMFVSTNSTRVFFYETWLNQLPTFIESSFMLKLEINDQRNAYIQKIRLR